jgi:hypothetical protein
MWRLNTKDQFHFMLVAKRLHQVFCKDIVNYMKKHFFYDFVNPYQLLLEKMRHNKKTLSERVGKRILDAYLCRVPHVGEWLHHEHWFNIQKCDKFDGICLFDFSNEGDTTECALSKVEPGVFYIYGHSVKIQNCTESVLKKIKL